MTVFFSDLNDQQNGNDGYDVIGNLAQDIAVGKGGNSIEWTVCWKTSRIRKRDGTVINYIYDTGGRRLSKVANGRETRYTGMPPGNVMSIWGL